MKNKEIEEILENKVSTADGYEALYTYIEELEDHIEDLEEENNDLQHEIDELNKRD